MTLDQLGTIIFYKNQRVEKTKTTQRRHRQHEKTSQAEAMRATKHRNTATTGKAIKAGAKPEAIQMGCLNDNSGEFRLGSLLTQETIRIVF